MSAQETTIATLQQQLHAQNVERFQRIEAEQNGQRKLLEKIASNTADLPTLKDDVGKLKEDRDKAKGAIKIVGALGLGGIAGTVKYLFFKH